MRLPVLLTLALMATSPAFSAETKCECSKECMTQCQKGQGKDCKCKHCDCKSTGKCEGAGGACAKKDSK